MLAKVPEAEKDAKEAGKALAFELGTACGFHTFRVVECVLRRYWDFVSQNKKRPVPQTLGLFATQLQQCSLGEERVWDCLRNMAKLHRNPIIHPEVILSFQEAIGILGIARSAIGVMLDSLPDAPGVTSAPALRLGE